MNTRGVSNPRRSIRRMGGVRVHAPGSLVYPPSMGALAEEPSSVRRATHLEGKEAPMRHLFEAAAVEDVKARIARLRPDSPRRWGTMHVAQAMAHCSAGFEVAAGERLPKRKVMGRFLGWLLKPLALGNDAPMRRNTPTVKEQLVLDERDLERERERLCGWIDRFAAAGPGGCTSHPHSFFGRLAPEEWATLMYKHLDHHLRQFGA